MPAEASIRFVIRRAFWKGEVRARDLVKAFGVSKATAGRWLRRAVSRHACLESVRRRVQPRLHATPPSGARPDDFFDLLTQRRTAYADMGLRDDEVSVFYASLRHEAPPPGVINADFIRALVTPEPIDIRYVGLKVGATAQWRSVIPVALESFQGQWRVNAHDLGAEGRLKSFVLNRLLETKRSRASVPKGLIIQQGILPTRLYRIRFNPLLTDDQRLALRWEMRADDELRVRLSEIEFFEFERQYIRSEIRAASGIVWPLVDALTPVEQV